jgi:hypothetical protein
MKTTASFLTFVMLFSSCATYRAQHIGPTPIIYAQQEIPEEQLLDVGIVDFESAELTEEQAKKQGTAPAVRKAEGRFIPYHLKNTLQRSSQWGMVRVIPKATESNDVTVTGKILESTGDTLAVQVTVKDSTGRTWFTRTYKAEVTGKAYEDSQPGKKDAFQDLYNAIANDMTEFKQQLKPEDFRTIRTVSKLRFARDFAPDAFGQYISEDERGRFTIKRLPAADDPNMNRVLRIREREYMFVDTLNDYYDGFYNEMWPSYDNWRKSNLTEHAALAKVERDAFMRQVGGALLVALAVLLQAKNVHNTGVLSGALVIAGGQVFISGINISKQAEIHRAAIEELGESFDSEMKPVVMEFEGKTYELTGTAAEQYDHWRELLRQIYYAETGFTPPSNKASQNAVDQKRKPADPRTP